MALSFLDRAANRASKKYAEIARLQRAGRHGEAFHVADGWVLSEVSKALRRHPRNGVEIYEVVTARLAKLAESIPGAYKRGAEEGSDAAP